MKTNSSKKESFTLHVVRPYILVFLAFIGAFSLVLSVYVFPKSTGLSKEILDIGVSFFPLGVTVFFLDWLQKDYYIQAIEKSIKIEITDHFRPILGEIKNICELIESKNIPLRTSTRDEMYRLGTNIIKNANKRLCIIQKTSTLLLGAKDYDKDNKRQYEIDFLDELNKWIDKTLLINDIKCLYLYCKDSTKS
ncbi:hypothetical protein ACFL0D_06435, partial [Thermoproteota archaeon]